MMKTRSPFFDGVTQREIRIRQYGGKAPVFFLDARILGAIYLIDYRAAQALLPDARLRAVAGGPGRAVLGVFAFDYGDTDLGPYREVFVSISVHAGTSPLPDLLRMAGSLVSRSFDAHVVQLPVDSEAALFGGLDYYNVPKFMAAIEWEDAGGTRTCTVRDPDNGELIFGLGSAWPASSGVARFSPPGRQTLRNFSRINGRLSVAKFVLHAPGAVVRFHRSKGPVLTLGRHARSQILTALKPGQAVASFSAEGAEAILYEPENFGRA